MNYPDGVSECSICSRPMYGSACNVIEVPRSRNLPKELRGFHKHRFITTYVLCDSCFENYEKGYFLLEGEGEE